jgi:tetratricopeptide (TPR) repeat protein
VKAAPAVNKEGYQLYVRAMHHTNKWTQEGIQLAIDLCRQAIDIDPAYAPPYATMALGYAVLTIVGRVDAENAFRQAKANARKALELDDTLAEAHAALGFTSLMDFNLADALREGKRAVELNPKIGMAYYIYAQSLSCSGHVAEAVKTAREGCEVDPLMAPVNYAYGMLLYYAHRWDEAELQLRRTLEISPNFAMAQALRSMVLARSGRFQEANQQAEEFMQNMPDGVWELLLAYVAALAGDRERAEKILAKHAGAFPAAASFFSATVYGIFGDLDRGFAALERARDLRFGILSSAAVNPALEPFRADPRWPAFVKSLNLGTALCNC